jgi:DNA-binding NtrC family response regulator
VNQLRLELLEFSSSLTAKSALLTGPIGCGKSTVARLIGLLKRVGPMDPVEAARLVDDVRFDGPNRIDVRYIPWYVELPLTGLVENLAEVQLFGATKGAYTGAVVQRAGVFEQASTGRGRRGDEAVGAQLTGGIVFLDEIGDLTPNLQAKLLPVLSGGVFYRVGGEGHPDHELQYRGITVAASWKRLDDGLLRSDLLSRVAAHSIEVPGLHERMEDFDLILDGLQEELLRSTRATIEDAIRVDPLVDRPYWRNRIQLLSPVGHSVRRRLAALDWARHGQLRGLTAALDQIISGGRNVDAVIEGLPNLPPGGMVAGPAHPGDLFERLMQCSPGSRGLAGHLRELEIEQRRALSERLLKDSRDRRRLAARLGIHDTTMQRQLRQLDRRRVDKSRGPQ